MNIYNYETYKDGFLVHAPGKEREITIHILVRDPYLGFKTFFLQAPTKNQFKLYRRLLKLNGSTFMVKWSIDEDGDVFLSNERLLRDLDFSEFEAALMMIVSAYEENVRSVEKLVAAQ